MVYCSVDRLCDFEFHDSRVEFAHFDDGTLAVFIKDLNIHKGTEQNHSDHDMEIDCARVTFPGFRVLTFQVYGGAEVGLNQNSPSDEVSVVYEGDDAVREFMKVLLRGFTIFRLEDFGDKVCCIEACGQLPFFDVRLAYDSVSIEWDCFRREAWYELQKQYHFLMRLSAPEGDREIGVLVTCDYEKEEPNIAVRAKYNFQEFWGRGKDYLWVDAFADLERNLPQNVTIKSCLTCRYGNMCPAGNKPGELFCTKDVPITQKSDLYFYTEDACERNKRSRGYTQVCDDYCRQSEDFYTYNDFLFR